MASPSDPSVQALTAAIDRLQGALRPAETPPPPNPVIAFITRNPAVSITLALVYLNVVGVIYSFFLLAAFDVNFFDLAETSDFLIGALKNPSQLLFNIMAMLFLAWFVYWSQENQYFLNIILRNVPRIIRKYAFVIFAIVPIFYALWIPYLYATVDAQHASDAFIRTHSSSAFASSRAFHITYQQRPGPLGTRELSNAVLLLSVGEFFVFVGPDGQAKLIRRALIAEMIPVGSNEIVCAVCLSARVTPPPVAGLTE
ncbi:MAG: hypothetical protein ACFB3T_14590 [Geminicoccaceae bacterium]